MTEFGPDTPPGPVTTAALLIDTENLFYDYGLWLTSDRFGYSKHLCPPGLAAAVLVTVDQDAVRKAAERAWINCLAWSAFVTEREVRPRRSYGKYVDWGVRSVSNQFDATGFTHTDVRQGEDKAEVVLVADFKALLPAHDTFVFGGEDHLVRKAVLAHVEHHELRFVFIVPEKNVGAFPKHWTTPGLNNAKTALLVQPGRLQVNLPSLFKEPSSGKRYYAVLNEAVVPTDAKRKADPAQLPLRAESGSTSISPIKDGDRRADQLTSGNPWELIAVKLLAKSRLARPTIDEMQSAVWRAELLRLLAAALDLSGQTELAGARIHQTFTGYPAAAADWQIRNVPGHAVPGTGWRTQLAAAVLVPEILENAPDRQENHPVLRAAYERAHRWIDTPLT